MSPYIRYLYSDNVTFYHLYLFHLSKNIWLYQNCSQVYEWSTFSREPSTSEYLRSRVPSTVVRVLLLRIGVPVCEYSSLELFHPSKTFMHVTAPWWLLKANYIPVKCDDIARIVSQCANLCLGLLGMTKWQANYFIFNRVVELIGFCKSCY